MQEHPVLENVLIGYSPVIDARFALSATRLTIFPERAAAVDAAALLELLVQRFALPANAVGTERPLVLNVVDEALLDGVLAQARHSPSPMVLEVPAFLAADPIRSGVLRELCEAGQSLAISGRPSAELSAQTLSCFGHTIVDVHDDGRGWPPGPAAARGSIETLVSGVRQSGEIEQAFARGAAGVIGWPMDDELERAAPGSVPPEMRGILDLMNRVEREEPVERMEPVLAADASLAFRLLRYLNSSAFGLRFKVTSFKHALMLLGHQRLKRWLALLLASGSKSPKAKPLMMVAARRGLMMAELARGFGDEAMQSEMFICGVFSLLDRLMRQPMADLMNSVPIQHRVQQSLLGDGPYTQHLALVQAVEQSAAFEIRAAAERVLVARSELNRAVLTALVAARELD